MRFSIFNLSRADSDRYITDNAEGDNHAEALEGFMGRNPEWFDSGNMIFVVAAYCSSSDALTNNTRLFQLDTPTQPALLVNPVTL